MLFRSQDRVAGQQVIAEHGRLAAQRLFVQPPFRTPRIAGLGPEDAGGVVIVGVQRFSPSAGPGSIFTKLTLVRIGEKTNRFDFDFRVKCNVTTVECTNYFVQLTVNTAFAL